VDDSQPKLSHHFHQIPIARLVTQVLTHTQDDDIPLEMPILEQLPQAGDLRHRRVFTFKRPQPAQVQYLHQSRQKVTKIIWPNWLIYLQKARLVDSPEVVMAEQGHRRARNFLFKVLTLENT